MLRYGTIRQGAAGIALLAVLTLALGFGYPLVVTGISQLFFHHQANGSLVYSNGKLTGSALLGQSFTNAKGHPLPQYFQPRPSAVDYNGAGSGASNLGPSNPVLVNQVSERARAYRAFNHLPAGAAVPVDAVTAFRVRPGPRHLGGQRPRPGVPGGRRQAPAHRPRHRARAPVHDGLAVGVPQ